MNQLDGAHESSVDSPQLTIPACTVIAHCALPVDIVLVSSDGRRFGAHSKNLGEFTGGFPQDIAPANGDDVPMPDLDSDALPLLLHYVHHHRQPDISSVPFKTLMQLAEAVEKYDVYSATEICRVQMAPFVNNHCIEVFRYASKHGYRKLMDDTALIAVQIPYLSAQIPVVLNHRPDLQAGWERYTEYWLTLFDACYLEPHPVLHPGGGSNCKMWRKFKPVVFAQLKREITVLSQFDSIVEGARHHLKDCRHCGIRADQWVVRVHRHISDSDSSLFTSFL